MPELPEVETVRRGLAPVITKKTIEGVKLHRAGLRIPFPAGLEKNLAGRMIKKLTRRAKYLLIHLDDGNVLIIHLGMSGQFTTIPDFAGYKIKKHDHMIVTFTDDSALVFNDARRFGLVMLELEKGLEDHPAFRGLGMEPLSKDFTADVLHAKLEDKKVAIKPALLDQRVIAGIGNIYASEALFDAKIAPQRLSLSLTAKETKALAASIPKVLLKAIESGGSSLRDFLKADGKPGYFQHSFCVYDRDGEPCPRCKGGGKKRPIIQKIVQTGRATYFCPVCQK